MLSHADRREESSGERDEKEHFAEVYNQGIVHVAWLLVDTATGVNCMPASHSKANGKPVVTPELTRPGKQKCALLSSPCPRQMT